MPLPFFCVRYFETSYLSSRARRGCLPLPAQGHYLAFHGLVELDCASFLRILNDTKHRLRHGKEENSKNVFGI